MHKKKYLLIFCLVFSLTIIAQNKSVISGVISNLENDETLPFASITLLNHAIGTISNENGEFDFYIPKSKQNDTLSISFIGFNSYLIPLKNINGSLQIKLQPAENILDEVVVSRLSPLDYIKKALDHLKENYPQNSYQSLAYYRDRLTENGAVLKKKEAIIKTYYPPTKDTIKNQHQLLLYKPAENIQQFQFMREWIDKQVSKEKKKAIKRGDTINEEDYDGNIDFDFGGPDEIIHLDINKNKDNHYLIPKHFKKYEYSFGEETSLNGEQIITINFKAKRKIDHMKDGGKILISKESYAIISIESTGKFYIPMMAKPIFFLIGLKITNPKFRIIINYQKFNEKWYPKLFRWDANISLKKRHTFKENEYSDLKIGQVLLINSIDSIGISIPKDKRFDSKEDMENQVYNDLNLEWQELNIVKD